MKTKATTGARLPAWLAPLTLAISVGTVTAQQPSSASADDPARIFANGLLARMTVAEKVEQMEQAPGQPMYTPPAEAEKLARDGVGSFLFFTDPVRINQLQHIAVTESRLHIPLLFGYDVIHGFRTIAPIPLAMAASWDMGLITRTQSLAANEARSAGVTMAFAPMVDIARDARWGRIMESAGEDPYLGEQVAAGQVRGFQGDTIGTPGHLLASTKHFAAYGAAVGGRDYAQADLSDEQLYNVYLRPYHAAVEAGSATVMSAYMNLNGVPATANKWLLTDVLRQDWGFGGWVISDWESVKNIQTHGFAATPADAALDAATAGVNMEMTSTNYRQALPQAVSEGKLTVAQLDDLVRPILVSKFKLGLFQHPYADMSSFKTQTRSQAEREGVQEAAEKTAVLLKNENALLPLPKTLRSVAVIGPLADSKLDTMGSWAIHGNREDTVTVAQGIKDLLGAGRVQTTEGVEIARGSATIFDEQVPPETPRLRNAADREKEFAHAIALASSSDAVVMVLGEAQTMSGESASRASLTLPGEQERLLEAVVATGKPVVLVLMAGRPLAIGWAAEHVPAILDVWYPGTEGGRAAARLLFGDVNPSGHLPVSWPRAVGQEPLFYATSLAQDPENEGRRYWDLPSTPQYPFGYGLSYTSFQLDQVSVPATVDKAGVLTVTARLRNTGQREGAEVVQLYTHQRAGSTARPSRELKAFTKVTLKPGESQVLSLKLPASSLRFWSTPKRSWVLEPGTFDVWVGTDATASEHGTFQLTGE